MDATVVAAIVAGGFALLAALVPLLLKLRHRPVERMELPTTTPSEGLSAVVGIVQKDREILMVRRRTRIGDLSWQFPAGVVKPGADLRDKIEQEVCEETGVHCKVEGLLGARVHGETRVLCNYVHCLYIAGEARNLDPEENAQVKWVEAKDVATYCTSDIFGQVQILLEKIQSSPITAHTSVGVVVQRGRFLMVKRRESDGASLWRFPGGSVEEGEPEQAAAAREVFEETGVRCSPVRKLGERTHPDTRERISYWLCEYESGEPELREPQNLSDVAWVEPKDVLARVGSGLFEAVALLVHTFET